MKSRTKTKLVLVFVSLILAASVIAAQQADETPEVLLERAIQIETVDGDLSAAIDLYKKIEADNSSSRAVVARALLHLGKCYEKLGRDEARQAYQRVLDKCPKQLAEVKLARERLVALAQQAGDTGKPKFRKIHIPTKLPMRGSGMLSPDGRNLAVISDGSLWLVPVHGKTDPSIAGPPVRLTEPMNTWDTANVSIAWTSDGKWIGFRTGSVSNSRNPVEGLYIISAEGGKPERLPITSKDWPYDVYTLRYALSPGLENFIFADGTDNENLRIYSMPARGGEKLPLTEPITREPALSPDGSNIAYVKMRKDEDTVYYNTGQVWMKHVQGGESVLVCEAPELRSPIWSPDGTMIAFLTASKKSLEQIWIVPISANGKPAAPSKFELPGETINLIAGWSRDNKIGILIPSPQIVALYTVPAEGGKAVQLTTEYSAMPRWTLDGARIYFDGAHLGNRANIEYIPSDGGAVVRLSIIPENIQPVFPSQLTISPDGKTLSYYGFYRSGNPGRGLFTVPIEGGTATRVAMIGPDGNTPEWSPDGTQIAFIRAGETDPGSQTYNIFVAPKDGGEPRQVSTDADRVVRSNLAWSPDGELIAFFGQDDTLRVIPASGGSSRALTPAQGDPWSGIDWSPDGKKIAYTTNSSTATGLHVISRDGGESKAIATGLDVGHYTKVDWSPDGKRIAFTASKGGEPELWLMEDFLPLVKGR